MILACQDSQRPRILFNERISAVSAHIVVRSYLSLLILDENEGEARFRYPNKVACTAKARLMRDNDPLFGEYGSTFQLI